MILLYHVFLTSEMNYFVYKVLFFNKEVNFLSLFPIKNGIYFSYKYIHGISINNTAKNKIMNDLSPLPNFSSL